LPVHRTAKLTYPGRLPAGGAHDTVDDDVHAVVAHTPEPAARSSRSATDGVTSLVSKERPVIVTIVEADAAWLTGNVRVIEAPAHAVRKPRFATRRSPRMDGARCVKKRGATIHRRGKCKQHQRSEQGP
jgi:hypothetical protein